MAIVPNPRAEAENIHKTFNHRRKAIMDDATLSESGKAEKVNALRDELQGRLDTLWAYARSDREHEEERDFAKAFGAPPSNASEALSLRDALARTKGMKADELAQTIREARRFGDDDLARAAGYRAYEAGFAGDGPLNDYLSGDEGKTTAVQRMIDRQTRRPALERAFFRLPG